MEGSGKIIVSNPALASYPVQQPSGQKMTSPKVFTARELEDKDITECQFIIEGILTPGVLLLAAPPKAGKTRLVTGIAVGLATGGKVLNAIQVEKCGVLCLFLEDSLARIKERLAMHLQGEPFPPNLNLATEWKTMDKGGLLDLEVWLKQHPDVQVVIIDVLRRFSKSGTSKSIYQSEYDPIAQIKALADKHGIAIILVHHTNKLKNCDDVFDMVSGSTGLTGACDTVAILKRPNRADANAKLHIAGRDIEARDLNLKYDSDRGIWELSDDPAEHCTTDQRREIFRFLDNQETAKQSHEIAAAMGKNHSTVRGLLSKMAKNGELRQPNRGFYITPKHNKQ